MTFLHIMESGGNTHFKLSFWRKNMFNVWGFCWPSKLEIVLVQKTIKEYDEKLEMYLPVLMQQAKIFWDRKNYPQVEKIFRKSVEFLNDNETWKVNVAHVLFMQEGKYSDAKGFYESLIKTVQVSMNNSTKSN